MKDEELIEAYFLGQLSSEQQAQFDSLYASDSIFKAEVQYQNDLRMVIASEEDVKFKETLSSFEKSQTKNKPFGHILTVASVMIVLIISSIFYFQKPSNDTLFADNFVPYANVIQPVVRGETSEDTKTKAFIAYENKDYTAAANYFTELNKQEDDVYVSFYLAISKLALDDVETTTPLLKEILTTQNQFTDKARWYLALAQIKNNTHSEAKLLLQQIVKAKSYKHEKAARILKDL